MKESNINKKQASWAQIKATSEVVKGSLDSVGHLLLTRPVLARLKTENTRHDITYITKGETRSVIMMARIFSLYLVHDLWGYDVEFQQKVVEKIFWHKMMKLMMLTFLSNLVKTKNNHLIVESIKRKYLFT